MLKRYVWCVLAPLALAGCPLDAGGDATQPMAGAAGAASVRLNADQLAAVGGSGAIDALVDQAVRDRFPPPPPLSMLCELKAGQTSFDKAKAILAKPNEQAKYPGAQPQSESQDATMAGLSYRFSAPPAKAAAKDADGEKAPTAVSLILRFAWSDGDVGWGTKIFGIGGSKEDFLTGYILKDMSLTGQPYPECWPHDEE